METDRLLSARKEAPPGTDDGNSNGRRCQTISTWALVVAVTFLSALLIADMRLRSSSEHGNIRSTSAADKSTTTASSSSTSTTSTSTPRYHATQFMSFTINTLGGLAEHGECEGRNIDPASKSCYLGDDDIETDVNHRLAILEEVLSILRQVWYHRYYYLFMSSQSIIFFLISNCLHCTPISGMMCFRKNQKLTVILVCSRY